MSGIRIFGIVTGLVISALGFKLFRGQRWNRLNFFLTVGSGLGLLCISVNPALLNILQAMFAFENTERGRILALLIVAVILLWLVVIVTRTALLKQRLQFDQLVRAVTMDKHSDYIKEQLKSYQAAVLMPAYNEAENLKELLPRIPDTIAGMRLAIVVVNDGSEDATYEIATAHGAFVVRSPIKRGGGAALRLGYDILRKAAIEICITMDADGQHDPAEIGTIIKPLLDNNYDIVIGSRIIGEREKDSLFRLAGVYFFSFVINRLTGLKITDPSSNFRSFKTEVVSRISLEEDQYHTSELIINGAKAGLRIGETPITILKRKHGTSKKGKGWKYGLNFAKIVFRTWWR